MKKNFFKYTILFTIVLLVNNLYAQNVGVNTTGAVPNASAGLDISFTNKGLLIPRLALSGTNVATPVTSPATSLLVYNTATVGGANAVSPGFYYWNGTIWVRLSTGSFVDTDDQTLSTNGDTLFIEDGNYVTLLDNVFDGDSSITNEIQVLSKSNDTIYLSNGGFVLDANDGIPVGATFSFPVATPPTGYLACDGSAVSRTTYASLFALIGVSYGNGNGTTTFNLPDYRGRFLRGHDNGAGRDPDALTRTDRGDGTTGDNIGTIQLDTFTSHLHAVDPPSTSTTSGGSHLHSGNSLSGSSSSVNNHTHGYYRPTGSTSYSGSHSHGVSSSYTTTSSTTPAHSHSYVRPSTGGYTTSTSTNGGYHSHSYYRPTTSTSTATTHNHSVSITFTNSNSAGGHNHSINVYGNTANSGIHSHNVDIPSVNSSNTGTTETRPKNIYVLWCIKF